jgi:hypothetical protein
VVGFDTTILPGREGSITEEVALAKVHDGAFTKCLTVNSNATNKPQMQLCIKGNVKMPVSASPTYLRMGKGKNDNFEAELTLSTEKQDLQVAEVVFKSGSQGPSSPAAQAAWQNNLPLSCLFTLKKPEKPNSAGLWEFKLLLTMACSEKESKYGEFVVKTNHPEAPEVKVSGSLEVPPEPKK